MLLIFNGDIFFSEPIFKLTRYGKPVIEYSGYRYNKICGKNHKGYWYCSNRNLGCKANLITYDNVIVKENSVHTHK